MASLLSDSEIAVLETLRQVLLPETVPSIGDWREDALAVEGLPRVARVQPEVAKAARLERCPETAELDQRELDKAPLADRAGECEVARRRDSGIFAYVASPNRFTPGKRSHASNACASPRLGARHYRRTRGYGPDRRPAWRARDLACGDNQDLRRSDRLKSRQIARTLGLRPGFHAARS